MIRYPALGVQIEHTPGRREGELTPLLDNSSDHRIGLDREDLTELGQQRGNL